MITAYDTTGTHLWQVYSFIKNTPLCHTSSVRNRKDYGLNEIPVNSINTYISELLRCGLIHKIKQTGQWVYLIDYPSQSQYMVDATIAAFREIENRKALLLKIPAVSHINKNSRINWNRVSKHRTSLTLR